MKRLHLFIALFTALSVSIAHAVTPQDIQAEFTVNPGKSGGIYYAYPYTSDSIPEFPEGYEPVYISHYGRHGSRWAINEKQYPLVINLLEREQKNGNLTTVGEEVLAKVRVIADHARGHAGELSPLGQRQHKAIARRMMERTPSLFADSACISALSSIEPRCIVSMAAFSESLKEMNPSLQITRSASPGDMAFIAYTTPEAKAFTSDSLGFKKDCRDFRTRTVNPSRILRLLFKSVPQPLAIDPSLKSDKELDDDQTFIKTLHDIAVTTQNVDLESSIPYFDTSLQDIDLLSLFTSEELFALWSALNYNMYVRHANSPQGKHLGMQSARSLLDDIIRRADEALASRSNFSTSLSNYENNSLQISSHNPPAVQLRFGHDTNLIRLLALMQLEGCAESESNPDLYYRAWQDYRVSPMGANLQLIFLRPTANTNPTTSESSESSDSTSAEPLVLILHNERPALLPIDSPTAPFYPWSALKSLWQ